MQAVLAKKSVSVSTLKKSPTDVVRKSKGDPVAVLNHNQVMAYLVPREAYEEMMERLDDAKLNAIAGTRMKDGKQLISVDIDDL